MTTRFGLIRHARTLWNLEKRIQGQQDTALAPEGESEACRWGRLLEPFAWDRILASDLSRARDTAERINARLNLAIETDPRLREQDWGAWTGKIISRLRREDPGQVAEQEAAGWAFRPPGGESRLEMLGRICDALADATVRWPGETVLVVTHEGVVKCLMYHLAGRQFLPTEPRWLRSRHLHRVAADWRDLWMEAANLLDLSGEPR